MPRFTDYDIKIDRNRMSPSERRDQRRDVIDRAQRFLRDCYPALRASLSRAAGTDGWGHWYHDPVPIRAAGTGDAGGLDLDRIQLDSVPRLHDYWDWPSAFAARGIDSRVLAGELVAAAEAIRLNRLDDGRSNPDFDHFVVRWPGQFRHCEVNNIVRLGALGPGRVAIQPATYLDSTLLNRDCDQPLRALGDRTLRQFDTTRNGSPAALGDSVLANGIGVACVFVDSRGSVVFNDRREIDPGGKPMAVMKDGLHVPSSGVLEWSDIVRSDGTVDARSFAHGLLRGMVREIRRECGIVPASGNLLDYRIGVLEIARELPRAGKPQVFLVARFGCRAEEMARAIATLRRDVHLAPEGHEQGDRFVTEPSPETLTYEAVGAFRAFDRVRDTDWDDPGSGFLRPASDFVEPLGPA